MKYYTTAQVVALLTRHPFWVFEAPDNDEFHHCKASAGEEGIIFESGNPLRLSEAALRDDWTLTHPKRRKVELGTIHMGDEISNATHKENIKTVAEAFRERLSPGKWRIVALEMKP